MFEAMRNRSAARRITPGDGRPLGRFRWWQLCSHQHSSALSQVMFPT